MTPLTTKSRQPLAHEWRRHSLVRVRRPVWAGHTATAETGREEQSATAVTAVPKTHTTHDDIAW